MNLAGLAADNAPPLEVPFGLFYLMPVFLGLAGTVLAVHGDQVLASRWTPAALAVTHFILLGALAPVMCGAILQIAPVLLGAPYPRVRLVALLTGSGLALGSLCVGAGFLLDLPPLLLAGGVLAGSGLSAFLISSFVALRSAAVARRETLWTVRLAIAALAGVLALGLSLASARLGWVQLLQYPYWVDTHVAWGLAGWVGLLLYGIAMQLIPLFYVTPRFPRWLLGAFPAVILCLLALVPLRGLAPAAAGGLQHWVIGLLFGTYLVYTAAALWIERQRKRPRRDANLWLWQASHAGVLAAIAVWLGGGPTILLGILLLAAAVSFIVGALLKIVPFLSWLDLQQRLVAGRHHAIRLPRLNTLLPDRYANAVALMLLVALLALSLAVLLPAMVHAGGVLFIAFALMLGAALARSVYIRQGVLQQLRQDGGR
ncbi:MAG: hypothetical protein KDI82_07785 [Gammaproteobacteria bacterium]|nr:hypothetical protein [Gammaproteobacteria bacterium]